MKFAGLILFLFGIASLCVGLWWIYPPCALIVGGFVLMWFALMAFKEARRA